MSGKIKNLLNRSGRYYARVAVPASLRPIVGKRELLEALGPDRRTALHKLPSVIAKMINILDAAKIQKVAKDTPSKHRFGQRLADRQIAKAHYESETAIDRDVRFVSHLEEGQLNSFTAKAHLKVLRRVVGGEANTDETQAVIGWALDAFASRGNFSASYGSDEWHRMAKILAATQIEAVKRSLERDLGNFDGKPSLPILSEPEPQSTDPLARRILGPDSLKPLSELVGAFLKERDIGTGSQHEHSVSVRMLEEFFEEPKPLYKITRRDVIDYKGALLELPSSYSKRFPKLTLPDAIIANKKRIEPYPFLAPRTVNNKWLSTLRALLNWCVQNDFIPDNPASGIKASFKADKGKPSRVNFEPSDLSKIFARPLFDKSKPWGETQWAYLCSLYCGTRPSELAQVQLDSVRHEREILVLRVQEETKNRNSQRAIPIHSELIRLGFGDYVAGLKKSGATHLFPEWYGDGMKAFKRAEDKSKLTGKPMVVKHHFPKFIPRKFNIAYRAKIMITDDRKDFYSFRHTFKTGLSQAGVGKDTRDSLTGHADTSAGATYVHDLSLVTMKDAIERLKFEGLNV
jgi:integrase